MCNSCGSARGRLHIAVAAVAVEHVGAAHLGEIHPDQRHPDHAVQQHEGAGADARPVQQHAEQDRKSTRLNSSHLVISYAVFCLKKKKTATQDNWTAGETITPSSYTL